MNLKVKINKMGVYMNLIKKFIRFLFILAFVFTTVSTFNLATVAATTKENSQKQLTPHQLEELNKKLEEIRIDINEQLASDQENVCASRDLSFSDEPLVMAFNTTESVNVKNNSSISLAAVQQRKAFSGYVANNYPAAGFKHSVSGSFLYGSGKVGTYSYDAYLTGPLYSKSHKTSATRLDPSVVRVTSNGTFKALKYSPVEYNTRVVIELYGSGTYRVITVRIN